MGDLAYDVLNLADNHAAIRHFLCSILFAQPEFLLWFFSAEQEALRAFLVPMYQVPRESQEHTI
jgi:hypothetical protein